MAEGSLVERAAGVDVASSALACLVIVGRRHGVDLSVERLAKDGGLPSTAADAAQLLRCAERAGFRCRLIATQWSALAHLRDALPAIVRMTDERFVVLLRVEGAGVATRLMLHDPVDGGPPQEMDRAAFVAAWSGDIVLIKRTLKATEAPEAFGFRTIGLMLLGDRRSLRDLGISIAALSLLGLVPIVFAQVMLTDVLTFPGVATFLFLVIGMAVLLGFEAAFVALRRALLARLAARLEEGLSALAFDHLLALPIDYVETKPLGLTTRRLARVEAIASGLGGRVVATLLDAGLFCLAIPLMLAYSMPLTAVVACFILVILLFARVMAPRLRDRAVAIEAAEAEQGAFLAQALGASPTIKTVALEGRMRQRWDVLTARVTRLRVAEGATANALQTVVDPLERLMVFGSFALGVYFTIDDVSPHSLGSLFGFLLLTHRIAAPVRELAALVMETGGLRRGIAELGLLMNTPAEALRGEDGVRLPIRGQVEFTNVSFDYPGATTAALHAVSFDIPMGTSLGIMGRTGAGKTTVTRLLQRLHADYQGLIKIDGIDVREYDVDHLRASVAVVPQDAFLFGGTIRDNILAARPDASPEEMVHAARMAGAEEFVERLPLGYDTVLQEGAPSLSDGERQCIAIARAVIADPRILVLDEATSALDPDREALVSANLKRLSHGRTLITISHRLSALTNADAILVLDRGEVQDIGRHHELLERCDIYSGLWQRQAASLEPPAQPGRLTQGSHVA